MALVKPKATTLLRTSVQDEFPPNANLMLSNTLSLTVKFAAFRPGWLA
ncbi:hypothetical protein LJR034_001610 [Caballeronia sp. LjRoot34]